MIDKWFYDQTTVSILKNMKSTKINPRFNKTPESNSGQTENQGEKFNTFTQIFHTDFFNGRNNCFID